MMEQLTVIIPFLNEGSEVEKTVASVRQTAATSPAVILINDGSDDGYGYEAVARRHGCRYAEHAERQGVAASRDHGVALSGTPYALLLDAHMEMYGSGWDERVIALLGANPRAVLFSRTQALTPERSQKPPSRSFGATIGEGLRCRWQYADPAPESEVCEVECILGAAYAFRKDYYERLHGLRGLLGYGADEELLSLKVRCEGGRCLLDKRWVTGHIYRNDSPPPFTRSSVEACHNRLLVAEIFFDGEDRDAIRAALRRWYGAEYVAAEELLLARRDVAEQEKAYVRSTLDVEAWRKAVSQTMNQEALSQTMNQEALKNETANHQPAAPAIRRTACP
jgi:glycosyltransferase involved in cell wall biosynthesis